MSVGSDTRSSAARAADTADRRASNHRHQYAAVCRIPAAAAAEGAVPCQFVHDGALIRARQCRFVRASPGSAFCCFRLFADEGGGGLTSGGTESAHTLTPDPRFSLMNRPTNLFARMSRGVISIGVAALPSLPTSKK